MPRKSSRKLSLRKYVKEDLVTISLRVPQSQYALLEALCKITHQTLPEQVALLLTDWVMPSVEATVHEHQKITDQPTPSTTEGLTKKLSPQRAANDMTESIMRPNENGSQKTEASPQSPLSPPAAPVDPPARRPVESPLLNDLLRPETPRDQQSTSPNLPEANFA